MVKRVEYITPAAGDRRMTAAGCRAAAMMIMPTLYTSWPPIYTRLAPEIKERKKVVCAFVNNLAVSCEKSKNFEILQKGMPVGDRDYFSRILFNSILLV